MIAHTLRALVRESRIAMIVVVVLPEEVYLKSYDWPEWQGALLLL